MELVSLLDTFLQRNVDYRHVLQELQEISQRLARVTVEQSVSIATLEAMMSSLVREEAIPRSPIDEQPFLLTYRADPFHLANPDAVRSSLERSACNVEHNINSISPLATCVPHLARGCHAKGGYILCKNHTYALDPTISLHIDVDEFLKCYQQGQRDNEKLVDSYEAAYRLYRGPFL